MFKPLCFYTFFVPLKVIFRSFWTRVWGNFEKMRSGIAGSERIGALLFHRSTRVRKRGYGDMNLHGTDRCDTSGSNP